MSVSVRNVTPKEGEAVRLCPYYLVSSIYISQYKQEGDLHYSNAMSFYFQMLNLKLKKGN